MQHQLLVKQQLEMLAKAARGQLHLAKQHKEDTSHCLEEAMRRLQLVQKDLEEQLLELHTAESAEREATTAVGQLEKHVKQWRAGAQVTQNRQIYSAWYLTRHLISILCYNY